LICEGEPKKHATPDIERDERLPVKSRGCPIGVAECFAEQHVPVLSLPKYRSKPLTIISIQFLRNHGSTGLTTTPDDRVACFWTAPFFLRFFFDPAKENHYFLMDYSPYNIS
jgi:hypothetical protein